MRELQRGQPPRVELPALLPRQRVGSRGAAARFAREKKEGDQPELERSSYEREEEKIALLLKRESHGEKNVYEIKRELQSTMEESVHILRSEEGLREAVLKLEKIKEDYQRIQLG